MTPDRTSEASQAQMRKQAVNAGGIEDRSLTQLRVAFWIIAGITGFLQIWLRDRIIVSDSLSYLDSGDILWRGDFSNAITCHWSPGLPFLLGLALKLFHPIGLWEVAVVKLVDMIVFLFTIACFDYFLRGLCRYHDASVATHDLEIQLHVPKLALVTVAYLLFLWTVTRLLPAWYTTPDMLVMGIVYLSFGILLKIRVSANGFRTFTILGVVLGVGYLVKAPVFPLAFIFLGVSFLLVANRRKAVPRIALAFGIFAVIASPLVWKLSAISGGLTFGKSGAWNYARTVDGIALPYHWHGQPAGSGVPLHPTRVLFDNPTVYEFGSPVRGTFPPWRDPYYWFAGITPHFTLAGQWRVAKGNARLLKQLASGLNRSFIYGFLILMCMSCDIKLISRLLAKQWFLLIPSIAAIAMFSLVAIEGRYIAPYPTVIGLVLFSGVAAVRTAESVKLVNRTVLLAVALFAASSAIPVMGALLSFGQSLHGNDILRRNGPWHRSSQAVSEALASNGIQRGDKVAYIGGSDDFYWARLAGVQVNAEIRQWNTNYFLYSLVPGTSLSGLQRSVDMYWASPTSTKETIDHVFRSAGSSAIVTDAFPAHESENGWDHVSGTSFYIHRLNDPVASRDQMNANRTRRVD